MRIMVILAALLLSTSCSGADEGHVELRATREVWMVNGNLNQKELRAGDEVVATCFAEAPGGYPGPVIQVRSGPTIGYAVAEAVGVENFDLSASALRDRLPDCGSTGLG